LWKKKNIEITGPLIFLKDSAKRGMYFMHGAYKHRILLQRLLHKKTNEPNHFVMLAWKKLIRCASFVELPFLCLEHVNVNYQWWFNVWDTFEKLWLAPFLTFLENYMQKETCMFEAFKFMTLAINWERQNTVQENYFWIL